MKPLNLLSLASLALLAACKAADAPGGGAAAAPETTEAVVASPTATLAAQETVAPSVPSSDGRSLCANDESVVFSCALQKTKELASLCASKGIGDQAGYVYFAQGAPGRADYVYPSDRSAPSGRFKRSHLGFGGGSGGFAYSFEDAGRKRIVYSISGERGLEDQGVIVAATGAAKADSALACEHGSVIESEDEALFEYTMSWPKDDAIESKGLPARN